MKCRAFHSFYETGGPKRELHPYTVFGSDRIGHGNPCKVQERLSETEDRINAQMKSLAASLEATEAKVAFEEINMTHR